MGGMTSLITAFSGLKSAQAGLYVTGHNMSNVETQGYVRQRVLQQDAFNMTVGVNNLGKMQLGLGTDVSGITQIRNKYLDITYRQRVCQAGYYGAKYETSMEIQDIMGEMEGQYKLQNAFLNMNAALQELAVKPQGMDTRENFISTAIILMDKINVAYDQLFSYQQDLDLQIRKSVTEVNTLVSKIGNLNGWISVAEASGDNANDYRDQRNDCLDRLSELMDITYYERADGRIDILTGGNELLVKGNQNFIGLRYTTGDYSFVEPVFTNSQEILPCNAEAKSVFNLTGTVSSAQENDKSYIKGLLVSRGSKPVNYATEPVRPAKPVKPTLQDTEDDGVTLLYPGGESDTAYIDDMNLYNAELKQYKKDLEQYEKDLFNANECMIPKAMKQLDTIVNALVTMINNAFAPYKEDPTGSGIYVKDPDAPYDLEKNQSYTEIFVRKTVDRFDEDGNYIQENPDDYYSLYTIGNIIVNPVFRGEEGGLNLIATSLSNDLEDNTLLKDLLKAWDGDLITLDGVRYLSVDDAYSEFITNIGIEGSEAKTYTESLYQVITDTDAKRSQISAVSLDEEMTNMLRYQHAYNAAARMVNVIDSMIDKIVNGMGRSGL